MIKSIKIFFVFLFLTKIIFCQTVNLVNNPSFEQYTSCSIGAFDIYKATYWNSIDSTKLICGADFDTKCASFPFSTPLNGYTFQYPKTGESYAEIQTWCRVPTCIPSYSRGYLKNRLRTNLIAGKVYCAKLFISALNEAPFGTDGMAMLFSDVSVDTILNCGIPLTFLSPQVKNPAGNIIIDTLNWIQVSGTFTATGIEKYLVIGNFDSDLVTLSAVSNATQTGIWSGYAIDDVSLIDFNLPAFAGPDKNISLGDSAFVGRPPEIGLECTWTTGTFTIGTGGGIWVKPPTIGTFSYVVTQNICGNIKIDTVNVNVSPAGITETELFSQSISIYPQPAKDLLSISLNNFYDNRIEIKILDLNGKEIETKELLIENGKTQVSLNNISDGVYIIKIKNYLNQISTKRLVIAR